MNVGSEGSGVPTLIERLLQANKVEPSAVKLSRLEQTPATVEFWRGGSTPWYLPRRLNR